MGIFFGRRRSPNKSESSRTAFDEVHDVVVAGFRLAAKEYSIAPSAKTSDDEILQIYSLTLNAWRDASKLRNEQIPVTFINYIALQFMQAYENMGQKIFASQFEYELQRYIDNGLRQDQMRHLVLYEAT